MTNKPILDRTEEHWQNILKITAFIILIISIVFILKTLKGIFIPLVLAIFITYLFAPIVEFLAKYKIPRLLTLFIILAALSVAGTFFTQIIVKNTKDFIDLLPTLQSRVLDGMTSFLNQYLSIDTSGMRSFFQSQKIAELLSSALNISFSFIGKFLMTILILIFIYLTYHNYPSLINKAFDEEKAKKIFNIVNNINHQIINYIFIKTLISAATGILTGVTCAILGVKFAVLWGAVAFFLNYIPYIGSIIAVIFPILLSAIQFGDVYKPLLVAASLIGIQLFFGSFLDPEMMGNKFNLSPILILISLFFWSYVWGIVGAFLAVPMTAMMKIILQNIEPLSFVAVLMSKKAE